MDDLDDVRDRLAAVEHEGWCSADAGPLRVIDAGRRRG